MSEEIQKQTPETVAVFAAEMTRMQIEIIREAFNKIDVISGLSLENTEKLAHILGSLRGAGFCCDGCPKSAVNPLDLISRAK